jgi:hypothetical protein
VNWKWLLVFPVAAFIVGTPVRAPALLPPIPEIEDPICDYAGATENYLLAYAYLREAPARSRALLDRAESERALCYLNTSVLRGRIEQLRK